MDEINVFGLSDINIGCVDGEKEALKDNFLDLFYTGNNKYEHIMQKDKFIISGRKGTGKTILAKYIEHKNNKNNCIVQYQKLNQMHLHEYIDIEKEDIKIDDRILFQEYFLYKQFASCIYNNKIALKKFINCKEFLKGIKNYFGYSRAYSKLKKFYEPLYIHGIFKDKEISEIKKMFTNQSVSLNSKIANIGGECGDEHNIQYSKIRTSFIERQENLKNIVFECLKYIRVILIIDDLDETNIADRDHRITFLINLLEKVNDINCNKLINKNESKCILLMRNDILDSFAPYSSNIQKIISDSRVDLNWFKDSSGNQLFDMIIHKIAKSNKKFENMDTKLLGKKLFPKNNSEGDSFQEIVKYSFGRPRDIITFIMIIIENNGNDRKFDLTNIRSSMLQYSNSILGEIKNEMSLTWDADMINDVFKLIREMGKPNFTIHEMTDYYKSNAARFPHIKDTMENILSYLYELGVVGTYKKAARKKPIYNWSFRGNGSQIPNFGERITVHFSIRKSLNLK